MAGLLATIDRWYRILLNGICVLALFLMVAFTVYTVVMRYLFLDPPVWGDLLTVLSNIWLVFMAFALTVREREHIALDFLHTRLPVFWAFAVQMVWTVLILALGLVICIYGYEAAITNSGRYWEMWYFTWEDGTVVFKPNYMPKSYPMMIMPISGALISVSAIISMLEDIVRYSNGAFKITRTDEVD